MEGKCIIENLGLAKIMETIELEMGIATRIS